MNYTDIFKGEVIMTEYITTSLKNRPSDIFLAEEIASEYSLKYIQRGNLSLEDLFMEFNCSSLFMVKNKELNLFNKMGDELFFHPGTGLIRTKVMERKEEDLLIKALGISPEDKVLDCTGGLANDSVVISYYLEKGSLTTLEKSRELFLIVKYGLLTYPGGSKKLKESFKRINLINTDYNSYFEKLDLNKSENVFDSIYFDPMFEKPVEESSGISKIRGYASYDFISKEIIEKALEHCKKRVVVKIRNNNYSFIRNMKPNDLLGNSKSKIRYAVFEKHKIGYVNI